MVSLLGLAPAELQGHLELNLGRLTSYELLRREMVSFTETKHAFTATDGAVPMDVDEMKGKKGPKGKGKKGQKDQGGKARETRQCFICQRRGHLAQDCWYSGKGNNPKGTKAQGSKGSGKARKGQATGRAHELEGAEGDAMAEGNGEENYPAEGEQDQAELGFIGVLDSEEEADYGDDEDDGDDAPRDTPGSESTDPMPKPKRKAKVGTASSTATGLRMADMSLLNKLQETRRELVQKLEEVRAKGDAEPHAGPS